MRVLRVALSGRCGVLVAGILTLLLFGCGANAERATSPQDDSLRRITLDKSDPERLLRYYFGGYVPGTAQDPFTVGLLVRRDGAIYLEQDSLARWYPEASQYLASGSDALDWDDLKLFLQATYYDARDLPPTMGDLRLAAPYRTEDWFTIELHGVMTTALRRIFVDPSALRTALRGYQAAGERLLYPEGTTIIGEHWLEGEHAETTVMLKRPDGFWDYMTYGSEGTLVPMTTTGPRQLQTPTQCAGCHFGDKQFEPERSFPAEARPGPHGPRAIYVDDALRDLEVTMFFDEHRKRSDYVLGLYNTLFVAQLRADREAGRISDADAALLDALGL